MPSERSRLEADLAAARAAMRGLRDGPHGAGKEGKERDEERLAAARARVAEAEKALRALAAPAGPSEPASLRRAGAEVEGTVRVLLPPGLPRGDRSKLVSRAVLDVLEPLLAEQDLTLSAAPDRYVRESRRDEEARTVLDLRARIEGDFLVPVTPPSPKGKKSRAKGAGRPVS